jgi:hypothetical protein
MQTGMLHRAALRSTGPAVRQPLNPLLCPFLSRTACLPACLPALQATSSHATRGAFATKHLWVTPYHPREMNPAGDYPLHPDPDQNQGIVQ